MEGSPWLLRFALLFFVNDFSFGVCFLVLSVWKPGRPAARLELASTHSRILQGKCRPGILSDEVYTGICG